MAESFSDHQLRVVNYLVQRAVAAEVAGSSRSIDSSSSTANPVPLGQAGDGQLPGSSQDHDRIAAGSQGDTATAGAGVTPPGVPVPSTGTSTTTTASGTGKLSWGVCEHLVVGQRAKNKKQKKEVLDSASFFGGVLMLLLHATLAIFGEPHRSDWSSRLLAAIYPRWVPRPEPLGPCGSYI